MHTYYFLQQEKMEEMEKEIEEEYQQQEHEQKQQDGAVCEEDGRLKRMWTESRRTELLNRHVLLYMSRVKYLILLSRCHVLSRPQEAVKKAGWYTCDPPNHTPNSPFPLTPMTKTSERRTDTRVE